MAIVGMIIVLSSAILAGMVIYARYSTCDPFRTGRVTSGDQVNEMFKFGKVLQSDNN